MFCTDIWILKRNFLSFNTGSVPIYYEGIINDPSSSWIAVVSAQTAWLTVNVTQGAVVGDADGLSGAAGDIAASVVLYGDVRDLVLMTMKASFGFADTGDKAVLAFAAMGVITTVYPPADVFVAAGKVGIKLLGNSALVHGITETTKNIIKAVDKEVIEKAIQEFSPFFLRIAEDVKYKELVKRVFKDGSTVAGAGEKYWVEALAKYERRFGGTGADLVSLEKKFRGTDFDLDSVLRATIDATTKVQKRFDALGVEMTPEVAEGIAVLMRHVGKNKDTAIYLGNASKAEGVIDSIFGLAAKNKLELSDAQFGEIMQSYFTNLKRIHDTGLPGVDTLIKKSSHHPAQIQGTYHHLIGLLDEIGLENLDEVEDGARTLGRYYDAATKAGEYYEFKNLAHYFGKNRDTVITQFQKDIESFSDAEIIAGKLQWVFRGSNTAKNGGEVIMAELQKMIDIKFPNKGLKVDDFVKFNNQRVPF